MEKRMTAEETASEVFDLIYEDADNRPRATEVIKARDKATLEAAADRWEREWWGFPDNELEDLRSRASDEQLEEIARNRATILRDEED